MKRDKRIDRAIAAYGPSNCIAAWEYSKKGEGPSNIGFYLHLTLAQANCAIDAGRWMEEASMQDAGL